MSVKRNVTVPVGSSISSRPFGALNGSYAPTMFVRCPRRTSWWDLVSYADETRAALGRAIVNAGLAAQVDTNSGHTEEESEAHPAISGLF